MTQPISLDIPHKLGKAAVRERLDKGIGKIGALMPGGGAVSHRWDGDTMDFTVSALGQQMACKATVFDDKVHAVVDLPTMLALFADKVRAVLGTELPKLLK
ncbi:MAG: polyhydroxyalkanoic acid system family protein [Sphingomonadaceae bacterium]|nr:polyhydroxyalkanoic acid system family protein [Sphingomonadaceae bacterium]